MLVPHLCLAAFCLALVLGSKRRLSTFPWLYLNVFMLYNYNYVVFQLWINNHLSYGFTNSLCVWCLQGDEQQTVDGLLHTLGLGKYAIIFKAEEVCCFISLFSNYFFGYINPKFMSIWPVVL